MALSARSVSGRLWLIAAVVLTASPALSAGDPRRDGKRAHASHVTNKVSVHVNSGRRLAPENERALVHMTLLRETIRLQNRSGARRCPGVVDGVAADCAIPSGARIISSGGR